MSRTNRILAQQLSEDFILSKLQSMVDMHLWPSREKLDPHAWLKIFQESEMPYAINLLNIFIYYNEPMTDALFRAAIQSLSASLTRSATSLASAKEQWRAYFGNIIVTYVEGEKPNPTDSGKLFARKARQVLGINEEKIVEPMEALSLVLNNPASTILFVDDFVGSGNQMYTTWVRRYELQNGNINSFSNISKYGGEYIYTPLIATSFGIENIEKSCFNLKIFPVYIFDTKYSLISTESILWPEKLKKNAIDVLYKASKRAGIVDNYKYGWKGFNNLALPLAFWHSVPDATLPLYFWESEHWYPLIRRS